MSNLPINPLYIKGVRWLARVISLVPILFAAGEIFAPHSDPEVKVLPAEWIVVGISFLCVIGLALAWRWEGLGGSIAVIGLVVFYFAYRLVYGEYFPAIVLVPYSIVLLPGVMFLTCWYCDRPIQSGRTAV